MENLARYIIRASFSQDRMTYIPEESKVLYRSKDGKKENIFDPWSGWQPCVPMSQTRGNRWSDIMASTLTSPGEDGKSKTGML